jgi:ribonuclease P protein component
VTAALPNQHSEGPVAGRRLTFPRSARLLRHMDFERVYKQGKRHFAAHMTVFYLHRPDAGTLRVGFTVGRVLGGAVQRNRMKRLLREAVRLRFPQASVSADVVINPKKSLLTVEFSELLVEVERAFNVIQQKIGTSRASDKAGS